MDREQIKVRIKEDISCTDYLKPAPNYSEYKQTGYCCPYCGSGTHGIGSTGAVQYFTRSNTWYCHSCHRGGDVIDLYRAETDKEYNDAIADLAAIIGISINDDQQAQQSRTDYTPYYKACRERLRDPAATAYLQKRGISTATAEACGIGFDPQADPAAAPGAMNDEHKTHPTPRIIVPCTADFYIARSIDPATPAAYKAPNPKGSRTQLFNAAALYSGADVVFVTEGIFDALSFIEAGHAAIATNGKGNGRLLLQQLRNRPTDAGIVIVPDNDENPDTAAQTTRQAAELNNALQTMNYNTTIYNIAGTYHDANDAFTGDRAAFVQNIDDAIRALEYDDLSDFLDKITTEAYKPHRTGLHFFDDLLSGGIIQQSLLLLLAAPGTGKTTLAQQIAEAIATTHKPVIYFNFEMSREQMIAKAISAKLYRGHGGDKTATQILQGYEWTAAERAQIEAVIDEYRRDNYPFIKYNPAGISSDLQDLLQYLHGIGEAARAKDEPAPAAIIDYLHLIKSRDGLDTQELIKQTVTGLKQYAVDYNTFVIGIIAANRASNATGKQRLDSGRDSSNLEYTADYQISLNYYDIDSGKVKPDDVEAIAELQQAPKRAMILRLLKSRFTQPGKSARVLFDAAHNIFYGTADDFIPAGGFELYDGQIAFDDDDGEPLPII